MKKRHFDVESDGFYGAYWKCKSDSDCAMIAMIGDDSEDYLARTSVKWLHKLGVNVMTMSPAKKDYGHHNYPLERIEKAISWLKIHGNQKIGIVGASTTGTLALTAASYFKDITLTIGLTHRVTLSGRDLCRVKEMVVRNGQWRENLFFRIKKNHFHTCRFVTNIRITGM